MITLIIFIPIFIRVSESRMMPLVKSVRSDEWVKNIRRILLSPKKCQLLGISVRMWV